MFSCVIQEFPLHLASHFFKSRDQIYKDEKVGNKNLNICKFSEYLWGSGELVHNKAGNSFWGHIF